MYKTFVVNEKDLLVMRTGTDGFQPKFDGLGATCWKDILTQKYPIY